MKVSVNNDHLLGSIKQLIEHSRQYMAKVVNAELTMLYWKVGVKINEEILNKERAEYGKQIVVSLARQLVAEYGNSFSEKISVE